MCFPVSLAIVSRWKIVLKMNGKTFWLKSTTEKASQSIPYWNNNIYFPCTTYVGTCIYGKHNHNLVEKLLLSDFYWKSFSESTANKVQEKLYIKSDLMFFVIRTENKLLHSSLQGVKNNHRFSHCSMFIQSKFYDT